MKNLSMMFVMLALTHSAFAAMSPEDAKKAEAKREGDLAAQVLKTWQYSGKAKPCQDSPSEPTAAYEVKRLSSESLAVDKGSSDYTYDAAYLVTKACFSGSTYAGAYRETVDAAIVKAHREGTMQPNGVIKPYKGDQISVVKPVDLGSVDLNAN